VTCHESEPLLHPYLDGELDVANALRVEEHLAGCDACGRYYENLEELRREIAGAGLRYRPKPALERRIAASRRPQWKRPAWLAAAAAVAFALLWLPGRLSRPESDREFVDSHIRSLMGSHLVDVPSSDRHTVKPWFQGKLAFSPDVPDLSAQGFALAGGRLDVARGAPAAALVYRRRAHVINLFVAPAAGADSAPRARSSDGYNVVEWTAKGMSYWAVSDLNAAELGQFAQAFSAPR
jgi:anti-sigma factor RsiW